jgi:hypothetical protein
MEHRSIDLAGRLRWGAVALAATATIALGGQVAAAGPAAPNRTAPNQAPEPPTDPFHACLHAGPTTPDRVEARAAECRLRTEARYADPAYIDCMRDAAGTVDTLVGWVESCLLRIEPSPG